MFLQEATGWCILAKCGHKPRKNNIWDSRNSLTKEKSKRKL